jgi:hypothetical protein
MIDVGAISSSFFPSCFFCSFRGEILVVFYIWMNCISSGICNRTLFLYSSMISEKREDRRSCLLESKIIFINLIVFRSLSLCYLSSLLFLLAGCSLRFIVKITIEQH